MKTPFFYFLLVASVLVSCRREAADGEAMGTFEATEVTVSAEVNGKIESLDLHEGDTLHAGQLVGHIDTASLAIRRDQILASRGAVLTRQVDVGTQVASLQQQIATQEQELKRFQELVAARAAQQKTVDDIAANLQVLRKQLAATQQTMERGNAGLSSEAKSIALQAAQMAHDIRRSYFRAPQQGVVLSKYVEQGEFATVGKPLFKMANLRELYLRVYVTAAQYNELRLGQKVLVAADKGDGETRTYDGRVTWISPEAEFTPKTIQTKDERQNLVYAVKVLVKNDGFLKIGMYGSVISFHATKR